jgi:hypothetical protein
MILLKRVKYPSVQPIIYLSLVQLYLWLCDVRRDKLQMLFKMMVD